MIQFMKKHDLWLRLLSVLLAFFLWIIVMGQDGQTRPMRFDNVRLSLTGENTLLDRYGLSVIDCDAVTVSVRVSGPADIVGDSSLRNAITATLDVSQCVTASEYDLTPQISINRAGVEVLSITPQTVHVVIDQMETKTIPVRVADVSNIAADGYRAGTPVPAVDEVTVEGPAGELEQVVTAYVAPAMTGQTSTVNEDCTVILYDEVGNPIESPHVKCQTATIRVRVPISQIQTLPLTVTLKDGGTVSADQAEVTITPDTVSVTGDQNVIAQMSEISLGEIDLASVRTGTPITRSIEEALPDGVQLDAGQPETAEITINIIGVETRSIAVDNFVVTDTSPEMGQYVIAVETEKVEIELRGSAAALAAVDAESFSIGLTVDSGSLGAGTHTVRGVVAATSLPSGVTLVEEDVQVNITITAAGGAAEDAA